mmetsp:Transcript_30354/g.49485  ORF Transcript_30354/g.49485 Transcript_30354/m.49485 type:complete len:618 (-) Transcript_30354:254-2107(-)
MTNSSSRSSTRQAKSSGGRLCRGISLTKGHIAQAKSSIAISNLGRYHPSKPPYPLNVKRYGEGMGQFRSGASTPQHNLSQARLLLGRYENLRGNTRNKSANASRRFIRTAGYSESNRSGSSRDIHHHTGHARHAAMLNKQRRQRSKEASLKRSSLKRQQFSAADFFPSSNKDEHTSVDDGAIRDTADQKKGESASRIPPVKMGTLGGEYSKTLAEMGRETTRQVMRDLDDLVPACATDFVPPQFLAKVSVHENPKNFTDDPLPMKAFEIPKSRPGYAAPIRIRDVRSRYRSHPASRSVPNLNLRAKFLVKDGLFTPRMSSQGFSFASKGATKTLGKASRIIDRTAWEYGEHKEDYMWSRNRKQRRVRSEFPWGDGGRAPEYIQPEANQLLMGRYMHFEKDKQLLYFDPGSPKSQGGRVCTHCGSTIRPNSSHLECKTDLKTPSSWQSSWPSSSAGTEIARPDGSEFSGTIKPMHFPSCKKESGAILPEIANTPRVEIRNIPYLKTRFKSPNAKRRQHQEDRPHSPVDTVMQWKKIEKPQNFTPLHPPLKWEKEHVEAHQMAINRYLAMQKDAANNRKEEEEEEEEREQKEEAGEDQQEAMTTMPKLFRHGGRGLHKT